MGQGDMQGDADLPPVLRFHIAGKPRLHPLDDLLPRLWGGGWRSVHDFKQRLQFAEWHRLAHS
ncbi:hypothetical protein D3C78_1857170 [compost metagenome]